MGVIGRLCKLKACLCTNPAKQTQLSIIPTHMHIGKTYSYETNMVI